MNIEQLMSNPLYRRRKWTNIMMLFFAGVAIVVGLFWLALLAGSTRARVSVRTPFSSLAVLAAVSMSCASSQAR